MKARTERRAGQRGARHRGCDVRGPPKRDGLCFQNVNLKKNTRDLRD